MEMTQIVAGHWTQLRRLTYDLLDALQVEELALRLNFERSQSIEYQFWCMLGAQESWLALLETGEWQGFSCSVSSRTPGDQIENYRRQMQAADEALLHAIKKDTLTREFAGGATPLSHYLNLVEHESHHQGQLINFIYAHDLPIPASWEAKWALKRD